MGQQYFVVGAGSIGRRHHANLQELGKDAQLLPWRGLSLDDLKIRLKQSDAAAVIIATATQIRLDLLPLCAELGLPFYVEKPLAYRSETLGQIFEVAAPIADRSILGLMMRYHPAFRAQVEAATDAYRFELEIGHDVRQWRENWSFGDSYAAMPEGGGVLLDLCHEIDMAYCLFPDIDITSVDCIGHANFPGVDFETQVSFAAKGGPVGCVSMDYFAPKGVRRLKLRGRDETVDLDLLRCHEIRVSEDKTREQGWTFERNDMFLDLMRDFVALVEGNPTSDNPLLPRLDRMYDSAALIARAWEARRFHGTLEGGF